MTYMSLVIDPTTAVLKFDRFGWWRCDDSFPDDIRTFKHMRYAEALKIVKFLSGLSGA